MLVRHFWRWRWTSHSCRLRLPYGGYAQQGKAREAMDLFHKFHSLGLKPSERTFSSVLGVFTNTTLKWGSIPLILIGNAILDFYMWAGIVFGSLQTRISMHLKGLCASLFNLFKTIIPIYVSNWWTFSFHS